jgi:hypothetical protein
MAVDAKYGRIEVENEPGNPLGEDEPVFLFRARDATILELLGLYDELCAESGSPPAHTRGIQEAVHRIREWRNAHPELVKVPD